MPVQQIAVHCADDCGYFGDPANATAENGALILDATVAGLATYLEAFAQTPLRLGIARNPGQPSVSPALPGKHATPDGEI